MARRCELTGTGVQTGNKVSHSNRKTRRRFLPNLRKTSLVSEALGKPVSLRITAHTLRTIEHHGGLDAFLLATSDTKLPEDARKLKRQIKKTIAKKSA